MDAIGAQEVHFPALLPREPYEASGRWTDYGDNIFRLKDRKGDDYLLGPRTRRCSPSWSRTCTRPTRTCRCRIYQIQTKYRDEPRPRAGILRGREFMMKDSYSFDIDDAGSWRPTRRTVRPTSGSSTGSASTTSSSRPCQARWAARPARSSSPSPRTARTPTSARPVRLRGQRRGRHDRRARRRPVRRRSGRARRADAGHADHRDAGRTTSTRSFRATTARGPRRTR